MDSLDTLETLALVGAAITFAVGIYQYWRGQQWKRLEFVATEVKQMREDPSARSMMQMLDWDGRRIDLFPAKEEGRWVLVTHEQVKTALRIRRDGEPGFTSEEARIRDLADALLEHLDRFGHFVEVGLISAEAFRPYLKYWLDLICDKHRNNALLPERPWREALQRYIAEYGYRGVMLLATESGYAMTHAPKRS